MPFVFVTPTQVKLFNVNHDIDFAEFQLASYYNICILPEMH